MRALAIPLLLFCAAAVAAGTVNVSVDLGADVHPFSPLIFGVAFGNAQSNKQMAYTVDRWGGNSTTRYNWRGPAHNAGNDYFFLGYGSDQTDSADTFIAGARGAGAQVLLTLPTLGWVQKFDANDPTAVGWGFSQAKYGAQTLDECRYYNPQPAWCHADAGNGQCSSAINKTGYCVNGLIVNNDPRDTSITSTPADDADWIAYLQSTYGTAADGGVKLYSLDNEVMLWNSTHRDVHPQPLTYADAWAETVQYATAVKQQDPNALVTGPVTWGYSDLFTSAKDATDCNCSDGSDRQAHADLPFVAWYLQQVCANPLANGKHLVDYLDLHYYPQGQNIALNSDDTPATAALRLGSLKELYDPTWVSASWIANLGDNDANHYDKPDLIPRVRAWIDQYCPGTKLAITEYNWGNDGTASGAVAQAEVLAIFAREGVDLATRWIAPGAGTNVEDAFSIFLDYDGAGGKVLGDSAAAVSASVDQIGAYAFHGNQRTMVLLTNKDTVTHDVSVSFDTAHAATWTLYGFDPAHKLHLQGSNIIAGKTLTLPGLLPISANLLVIPDNDDIFRDGFEPAQ